MNILLTNDDGIQAIGLRTLYKSLKAAGHAVQVVAPVAEQSAVGHAVTLSSPLRVKEFKENGFHGYGIYGTPVDCVKLGLNSLLTERPDIVVSGINAGCNVGVDIVYSGTVSAATEGAFAGIPALAVSYDDFNPSNVTEQADWAAAFVETIPLERLPRQCVLNLNFPARPMAETKGLKLCPHTPAAYEDVYDQRIDPRGRAYYWLAGEIPEALIAPHTDKALINAGHITLTPLRFDFTDHEALVDLAGAFGELV